MTSNIRIINQALRTTAVCALLAFFIAPSAASAFNPNEGDETPTVSKKSKAALPSIAPLMDPMPALSFAPIPPADTASQAPLEAQATIDAPIGAFVQPLPPALPPAVSEAAQFPPVDAAVAARAAQELQVMPTPTEAPAGFIAPAPLLAIAPVENTQALPLTRTPIVAAEAPRVPIENPPAFKEVQPLPPAAQPAASVTQTAQPPMPVGAIPVAAPAPTTQISDTSRDILSKFPSKLSSSKAIGYSKGKNSKLAINRLSPDIQAIAKPDNKIASYDATGLSIKIQRPGLDTNFELNRAYNALTAGDSTVAIETYKNILSTEPSNEDALFGLASTYHRIGNLEKARPYYAQLLKVNPNHREGLSNFLALVSTEAPQEALAELERLEQRNPDFSPIPAQQAALLMKNGYPDQAREKMLRAIELAPDNLAYKYNLAVMLDKQGNYADASALYQLLIDASLKGEKIPASLDAIQKRLNFISRAADARNTSGS